MRKTLSLDLRQRILSTYDEGRSTREKVSERYRVSLGMVKKLLAQRKRTGDIGSRYRYSGRKPYFTASHRTQLGNLIQKQPDMTLEQMREKLSLSCTIPAIYYVLKDMGLSYKKNATRQRARQRRRQAGAARMDRGTKKS